MGYLCASFANAGGPYDGLDLFAQVLSDIEDRYVLPPSRSALIYGALEGMVDTLDSHCAFFDPPTWNLIKNNAAGAFVGLGFEVIADEQGFLVSRVIKEGPADKAGLLLQDRVLSINGVALMGLEASAREALLRGEAGHVSVLRVIRNRQPLDLALANVPLPVVDLSVVPLADGVLWLRLGSFREGSALALRQQLAPLKPTGIVLDLRGNLGGWLEEGVGVADIFLSNGRIVSTEGPSVRSEVFEATVAGDDWQGPLVVLINAETASAAEIVAGALQQHKRASLVGERSYGKGSVQSILHYADGSALKLTIARYLLPDGTWIQQQGLSPDHIVVMPASDLPPVPDADPQLQSALKLLRAPKP